MIRPSRKSIRKKEFNYALPGYYHITMCCYQHQSIFGNVVNEKMQLNEFGLIANKIWHEIEIKFSNVHIYALQIMPNHLHVIIQLIDTKIKNYNLLEIDNNQLHEANISNVVGSYKSIVTNRIY
ncbi:MAG: hypothetical protein FGM54_05655 [Chitinophagaceae bacterium]|nr:hypothetical protein [Chitinophagaceae bacterium]